MYCVDIPCLVNEVTFLEWTHQWYENVEDAEIDEMFNFKTLIETNEQQIMNYFLKGETNAMAEGINSKIQRFISSNQGTRDRDFFFFKLGLYFS